MKLDALHESRRQLDETQAIAHIGSWTWDAETDRVAFTDEQYRLYGLDPGSYVDLDVFLGLIDERDRGTMLDAVRHSTRTGEAFLVLHRIARDGETRWIEGRGQAFRVGGWSERMVGTCLDVTERQRYEESLRATIAEVRASRARIVEAADAERRRVERDLHDGAQQRLLSLSMAIRLAQAHADTGAQDELRSILEAAATELAEALTELRDLARGIHPTLLTGQGLGPALESLALRSPLPAALDACPAGRFPEAAEVAVYYVAAEALTNAARHARATHATIAVEQHDGSLLVTVADDGRGGASIDAGSGLRGLSDRVAALGGRIEVLSAPGEGTRVSAEVPCE